MRRRRVEVARALFFPSKYSHSKYSVLALPLLRYLGEAELERLRLELEGRDLVAIWDALDLDLSKLVA